jgi:hypothetical protein
LWEERARERRAKDKNDPSILKPLASTKTNKPPPLDRLTIKDYPKSIHVAPHNKGVQPCKKNSLRI